MILRLLTAFMSKEKYRPQVLIGSTDNEQSRDLAGDVQTDLDAKACHPACWYQDYHQSEESHLDKIHKLLDNSDLGVYVFSRDDVQDKNETSGEAVGASSGNIVPKGYSTRERAVAELFVFVTVLGKENTFVLVPTGMESALPFSLLHISPISYDADRYKTAPQATIGTAIGKIKAKIKTIDKPRVDKTKKEPLKVTETAASGIGGVAETIQGPSKSVAAPPVIEIDSPESGDIEVLLQIISKASVTPSDQLYRELEQKYREDLIEILARLETGGFIQRLPGIRPLYAVTRQGWRWKYQRTEILAMAESVK